MLKLTPRGNSRQLALRGIYCYIINPTSISEVELYIDYFIPDQYKKSDLKFLQFLLEHSIKQFDLMLSQYKDFSDRDISTINTIEKIILVIAAVELIETPNIDSAIIINEAINLSKVFATDKSYKFINTLVDKLSKKIRGVN